MKKRILISFALVVLLLEVGFGVYVAFERKHESVLSSLVMPIDSVKPVLIDSNGEFQMASLLPGEDIVGDTPSVVSATKALAQPVKPQHADMKLASISRVANPPAERRAKLRAGTEATKQAVAVRTTEVREVPPADVNAQNEAGRTNNKSFIAKTGTILKKPFGWIKAIGSKLR